MADGAERPGAPDGALETVGAINRAVGVEKHGEAHARFLAPLLCRLLGFECHENGPDPCRLEIARPAVQLHRVPAAGESAEMPEEDEEDGATCRTAIEQLMKRE